MLWTVIDESDIFRSPVCVNESIRSTNPFDYIQGGYTLDNAALFGGRNNVSFNSDISGFSAGRLTISSLTITAPNGPPWPFAMPSLASSIAIFINLFIKFTYLCLVYQKV